MGFFSGLFGTTTKPAEAIADTIHESAKSAFSLVDNAFYTDQEKGAAKQKIIDTYVDLYKTTAQESSGTAEARRWFLQVITSYVLFAATVVMVALVLGYTEQAKIIVQTMKDFWIGESFVSAVSFYYLTHIAKAMRSSGDK